MTRTDFVKVCAERCGISQKLMKEILVDVGNVIVENIKDEHGVTPFQGMKFFAVYKNARKGRNPQSGESIEIAAKYQPKVRFGANVKDAIN